MGCSRQNGNGVELIMAYTAGNLEPEKQIELERHILVCESCREMADRQRAVWDALELWRPQPISADFNARLYRGISEEKAITIWQRLSRVDWPVFRPAIPVAAACAAIMIAFLVNGPRISHSPQAPSQQKVSIEQVERALDDMDMLKQLSLPPPPEQPAPERI